MRAKGWLFAFFSFGGLEGGRTEGTCQQPRGGSASARAAEGRSWCLAQRKEGLAAGPGWGGALCAPALLARRLPGAVQTYTVSVEWVACSSRAGERPRDKDRHCTRYCYGLELSGLRG